MVLEHLSAFIYQAIYVSPYSFKWEIPQNVMCVESKTKKKKKLTGNDYLNQKTFHKQRFETV